MVYIRRNVVFYDGCIGIDNVVLEEIRLLAKS